MNKYIFIVEVFRQNIYYIIINTNISINHKTIPPHIYQKAYFLIKVTIIIFLVQNLDFKHFF